jgi:transposase
MFADEARFGRMNRPRPCWAPIGIRPEVACQLIREYVYLYGAVSPKDGTCIFLILPAPDTECFQIFLQTLAKKYYKELILLFVDGAGNHCSDELEIPANIILHLLPPYSPELNPQENVWDEIREKNSRTMPSNPWTTSTQNSMRLRSTSNAIQRSSNPSPHSLT